MSSQTMYQVDSSKSLLSNTSSSFCFSGCFSIGHASVYQLDSPHQDVNPDDDFYASFPDKVSKPVEPTYKRQTSLDRVVEDILNLEDSTGMYSSQLLQPVMEDTQLSFSSEHLTEIKMERNEYAGTYGTIKDIEASLKKEETSITETFSYTTKESLLPEEQSPFLDEPMGAGEKFQDLTLLLDQKDIYTHSASQTPLLSQSSIVRDSVSSQDSVGTFDAPFTPNSHKRGSCSSDVFDDQFETDAKQPKVEEKVVVGRYKEMRKKNNMASRRSRQSRKEKEREMEAKAAQYLEENALLKVKVKNLEELANELKRRLIATIVKGK